MVRWLTLLVLVVPVLLGLYWPVGWSDTRPARNSPPTIPANTSFAVADCGSITGKIGWTGDIPRLEPIRALLSPRGETGAVGPREPRFNPRLPQVNSQHDLAGAVVLLVGVDPQRARSWDHPPVRLEIKNSQLQVHQGKKLSRVGFVQRGQQIDIVSRDPYYHSLLFRGAAFAGMPIPDRDQILHRRLDQTGVVEITSGSGSFWMLANLFVMDTPYMTATDEQGEFSLEMVPAGTYDLVVWHPDWREQRRELDGDSWEIASIRYPSPLTLVQSITVKPGKPTRFNASLSGSPIPNRGDEPVDLSNSRRNNLTIQLDPHARDR